jgi:hypothetical protein
MIVFTVLGFIAALWIVCAIVSFIIGSYKDPSIFADIEDDPILILVFLCIWWTEWLEEE